MSMDDDCEEENYFERGRAENAGPAHRGATSRSVKASKIKEVSRHGSVGASRDLTLKGRFYKPSMF